MGTKSWKSRAILSFILFCVFPLISGKIGKEKNAIDSESESNSDSNPMEDWTDGSENYKKDWLLDEAQSDAPYGPSPKLFAGYRETYITKEAAKKFLQKIRSMKRPYTEEEYDDLLQKIIVKTKPNEKYSIYDKKYFDYLPTEHVDTDLDFIDIDDSTTEKKIDAEVKSKDQKDDLKVSAGKRLKRINSRRLKRSTDEDQSEKTEEESQIRQKRQQLPAGALWSNDFVQNERNYQTPAGTQFISRDDPRLRRYTSQFQPYIGANQIYSANNNPNNPWDNKFYGPNRPPLLNNFYLPVPPPTNQIIVRPEQPFMRYPIPDVVFNRPYPPQNPPFIATKPITPTESQEPIDVDLSNRFDDDRVVWDIVEHRPTARPFPQSQVSPGRTQRPETTTTRRPPPPLIHDSDADDAYNMPTTPRPPGRNQNRPATTRRPPPPLIHNSDDDDTYSLPASTQQRPSNQVGSSSVNSVVRQENRPPQSTTRRPPAQTTPPQNFEDDYRQKQQGPSRCVWAIVNCCSPRNPSIRYACFEKVGCQGAFWDLNPCSDNILDLALEQTYNYFN